MRIALLSLAALRCSPFSATVQAFATPVPSLSSRRLLSTSPHASLQTLPFLLNAVPHKRTKTRQIMYCGG
ncbi:unnamed protein product [Ectocarpus sp. 8 AP-2014]